MRIFVTSGFGWIVLALLLSACGYNATNEERKTVEAMTLDMQTWGMGRHLIDLPRTWRYGGGDVQLYFGLGADFETVEVRVSGEGVSERTFTEAVESRVQKIKLVENIETATSMLIAHEAKGKTSHLVRYYRRTNGSKSRVHEIHLLVGDVYVVLTATSYEGEIKHVESRLNLIATQIHKVVHPERVGAGFVLGPVIIGGNHDHEDGTVYFYDPNRLDVNLEVGISAVTPDEEVRLSKRAASVVGVGRNDYLRDGSISLAGMEGEEALLGYDTKESSEEPYRQLLFVAESYRKNPGYMQPTLSLWFSSGGESVWLADSASPNALAVDSLPSFAMSLPGSSEEKSRRPVSSSLTDFEAIGLWDAIIKSIRPRASAVAAPPEFKTSVYLDPEKVEAEKRILDDWLNSLPLPPDGTKG